MPGTDVFVLTLHFICCFRQHFYLWCSFSHMMWNKLTIYFIVHSRVMFLLKHFVRQLFHWVAKTGRTS